MQGLKKLINKRHIARQFERSEKRMHCIAMSWGCEPDLARDLVQETFMIALDKHAQLRDCTALERWLISILANCHRAHYRKQYRTRPLEQADELQSTDGPEQILERQAMAFNILKALGRLNDDQLKVLTLVDMEGMSYLEVASILDIRMGTVMSRLARARKRMRNMLQEPHALQPASAKTAFRRVK